MGIIPTIVIMLLVLVIMLLVLAGFCPVLYILWHEKHDKVCMFMLICIVPIAIVLFIAPTVTMFGEGGLMNVLIQKTSKD